MASVGSDFTFPAMRTSRLTFSQKNFFFSIKKNAFNLRSGVDGLKKYCKAIWFSYEFLPEVQMNIPKNIYYIVSAFLILPVDGDITPM